MFYQGGGHVETSVQLLGLGSWLTVAEALWDKSGEIPHDLCLCSHASRLP